MFNIKVTHIQSFISILVRTSIDIFTSYSKYPIKPPTLSFPNIPLKL